MPDSFTTAQQALDQDMLKDLSNKTILLGVIDLGTSYIESAQDTAARYAMADGADMVMAELCLHTSSDLPCGDVDGRRMVA